MAKLAIIGASTGQLELCKTAKRMGLTVICFAWPKNAVCKDIADIFYPISVIEKDRIASICKKESINGVVSNASDLTAETVAYISEQLNLPGNPLSLFYNLRNKEWIRNKTNGIRDLAPVSYYSYNGDIPKQYPCIVKPISGYSKKGVSFVPNPSSFDEAISYAQSEEDKILIESYVSGKEYSVETLSFNKKHYVIQITEKITTGPPHFVELEHHQPAVLPYSIVKRVDSVICRILDSVGFENGAAHIEIKIDDSSNIYLIEINPRGGGDYISDTLVNLSTGYDYLKGMIQVALNSFAEPKIEHTKTAGVYFLCQQSRRLLPLFLQQKGESWLYRVSYDGKPLQSATGNYDRNGFLVYCSDAKIIL